MRSFQQRLPEFEARGIRVVGISVDPPEKSRSQAQKSGYTFPLLSDTNAKITRRYDVLHPAAGPKGADIARPAEFLLDSNGVIRWVNLTEDFRIRARPEQMIEAAKLLQ